MKLLKCYVYAFGKLKDFSCDFNSGLNTVKEPNGWGKSTLTVFIKAMFYGLSGNGKRSISENERAKYKPWGATEKFGGYVDFEWGGKSFRIEKYFGNKEAEDTVRLTDLVTGREYPDNKDLGKRIFSIDEEGFLSTAYFSQKDFEIKSNASITAKFNDVCQADNGEAYFTAIKKIEEKAKTYKARAERGLYYDAKRELFAVNEKIDSLMNSANALTDMRLKAECLGKEMAGLKEKADKLAARVAEAGKAEAEAVKAERYETLLKERENITAELFECEKVLCGNIPEKEEIETYFSVYKAYLDDRARENNMNSAIKDLENGDKKRREAYKKRSRVLFPLTLGFSVLFIAGLLCFLFSTAVGGILSGTFGFALVLSAGLLFLYNKKGKGENSQSLNEYYAKYSELGAKRAKSEGVINAFLNKFLIPQNLDFFDALNFIKTIVEKYRKCSAALKKNSINLEKYKTSNFGGEYSPAENISAIKAELFSVQDDYSKMANELARQRAMISKYEETLDALPELNAKKEELTEKIAEFDEEYRVLSLALEFLRQADENLKVKYRAPLENRFNGYLSLITDEQMKNARIDVELHVTLEEKSGAKETDFYSKGYRNIFEMCKRFALTDVIFKGEKPFIILDDPFYNLDDEKLVSAIDLVKELAGSYQILYFVCHESRRA